MSPRIESIAVWLADFHLLGGVLLAFVVAALAAIRQPAQRLAVVRATFVAVAALAALSGAPGWSLIHLLAPDASPTSVATHAASPLHPAPTDAASIEADSAIPAPGAPSGVSGNTALDAASFDWRLPIIVFHGAGSAVVVSWLAMGGVYAQRLRRRATCASPELQRVLTLLVDGATPPQLLTSDSVAAPVALGWRRPAIVLPSGMIGEADAESSGPRGGPADADAIAILAHEWAHIRHGDLWMLAASRLLSVLLWPQPLYWGLRRMMRLDQEALADAATAERINRTDYAAQLVTWARHAPPGLRAPRAAGAVGLWEGTSQLKRRVAMLLDDRRTLLRTCSLRWRVACGCALAIATLFLSAVTIQPGAESEAKAQPVSAVPDAHVEPTADAEERAAPGAGAASNRRREPPAWAKQESNVIKGRAIDEVGDPLRGVEISLYRYSPGSARDEPQLMARHVTEADGVFRFDNVVDMARDFPEGLPDEQFLRQPVAAALLVARAAGQASQSAGVLLVSIAKRGYAHQFQLLPAATLRGRVVGPDDRPVADAGVSVGLGANPSLGLNSARTDADGRFLIADLPEFDAVEARRELGEIVARDPRVGATMSLYAGTMPLVATHSGFATKRVAVAKIPGEVNVALAPGAVIEGRIASTEGGASRSGAVMAGASVRVTREMPRPGAPGPVNPYSFQTITVEADADGHYRVDSLPAGRYSVGAIATGWVTRGVAHVEARSGATTLAPDVVLTRGGRVRLYLVDAESGAPLSLDENSRGWVHPRRSPPLPEGTLPIEDNVIKFSPRGVGEFAIVEGDYVFLVEIPGDNSQGEHWQSVSFETLATETAHAIVEGETSNVSVAMKRSLPATGTTTTLRLSGPPIDDEAEDGDDRNANHFVPSSAPADVE